MNNSQERYCGKTNAVGHVQTVPWGLSSITVCTRFLFFSTLSSGYYAQRPSGPFYGWGINLMSDSWQHLLMGHVTSLSLLRPSIGQCVRVGKKIPRAVEQGLQYLLK
ncbi:hypothetical protein CEXT_165311 [Caerostris extrusa]|uniref:Uncharacterized protein n=1 Tax=Caerostris extrusa TaxID=172846 RepID=A0AAV4T9A1_CAEEX|nr:hypothetical protein CEXT_165311 [Caerostris extrusa]